jgi:catalase
MDHASSPRDRVAGPSGPPVPDASVRRACPGAVGTVVERRVAEEDAEIAGIVHGFLAVQARAAADQQRPLARGTHAKGISVRGVFEVLGARDESASERARLAVGLYARPATYPAIVRFANSAQHIRSDWVPDVRSLSFSVDLTSMVGAGFARQDFALQSAPTLPFDDLHAFAVFARVMSAPNDVIAASVLPFRDQYVFARTKLQILRQQRQPVHPYQLLRYWSNVAFRHGEANVVKYSLLPSAANRAHPLQLDNPDALRDELARHLAEDPVPAAFDLAVQFLDPGAMTYQGRRRDADFWIEHPSVEWSERQAPFHVVGRLRLLPGPPIERLAAECMYIDVTEHSLPEHRPLGAINRARWQVQVASRNARRGLVACEGP